MSLKLETALKMKQEPETVSRPSVMIASGRKVRVLHVIKILSIRGAETNLVNLMAAFDPARFENHVAYSAPCDLSGRFEGIDVKVFQFATGNPKIKSWASAGIIFRLARYILEHDIDIVHTHIFNAHVWGSLAGKLTGRKVVEHVHDFRYMESEEFRRRRGLNTQNGYAKHFRRLSDRIVVLTSGNREFLVNRNFPERRIRQIQNGICLNGSKFLDAAAQANLRAKLGIPPEAKIILTSASIVPEKNVHLIFEIAPKILQEDPAACFLVCGDGPLLESYRALAAKPIYGLRIKLIGFYDKIYELLSIADIFFLPSFLELHSIATLEAMSMKVPVVISKDVGCNNDYIRHRENGFLLDPFSSQGWGETLAELLKNDALRRSIGEAGWQTALDKFNIHDIAGKIERVYMELVGD